MFNGIFGDLLTSTAADGWIRSSRPRSLRFLTSLRRKRITKSTRKRRGTKRGIREIGTTNKKKKISHIRARFFIFILYENYGIIYQNL